MQVVTASAETNISDIPNISIFGKTALVLGVAFAILAIFGIGLVMPLLASEYAGTAQAPLVPWMASLVGPAFALSSPVAGYLIGRYGYKQVYLLSIPLFVIAGTAPLVLNNLWAILPFRLLLGAGAAGVMTSALDGIGRLPAAEQPALFGLQNVIASITGIIAFPLIGYLSKFGWHVPFVLNFFGLLVLPFAFALPRWSPAAAANSKPTAAPRTTILSGFSWPLFLLAGSIGLVIFAGSIYSPSYLAGIGAGNAGHASLALTIGTVVCMFSSGAYGRIHGRFGTSLSFVIAMSLIALGMILLAVSYSFITFTLGLSVYGLGIGMCAPNIFTWATENNPISPGQACGFANCALYLTPICFPFIEPLSSRLVGAGGIFILLAAAAVLWAIWFMVKSLRRQPQGPLPDSERLA